MTDTGNVNTPLAGGTLPIKLFANWLAFGERGVSSEAIVTHLTGVPLSQWGIKSEPFDPSDFRRCERMLRQVPLARLVLEEMDDVSPVWARIVDAWDELVTLAESEVPGVFDGADGRAPRTYARMKELRQVAP